MKYGESMPPKGLITLELLLECTAYKDRMKLAILPMMTPLKSSYKDASQIYFPLSLVHTSLSSTRFSTMFVVSIVLVNSASVACSCVLDSCSTQFIITVNGNEFAWIIPFAPSTWFMRWKKIGCKYNDEKWVLQVDVSCPHCPSPLLFIWKLIVLKM